MVFKDKNDGDNGKSKFAQACLRAMGTYGKVGNREHIYKGTGFRSPSGHNAEVFAYIGYRVSIFEELDDKRDLDTKKAKDDNGGNSSISARPPHGRKDQVVPLNTKWIMIFNHGCQPNYDTSDKAFLERMIFLPFRSKFYECKQKLAESDLEHKFMRDPNIDERIMEWQPYILRWMIEGHRLYMQEGLADIPESCREYGQEVHRAVDNLDDWVHENLVEDAEEIISLAAVKEKMPLALKRKFKNNDHMIERLNNYLGKCIIDSGKGADRIRNGWKGWRFQL